MNTTATAPNCNRPVQSPGAITRCDRPVRSAVAIWSRKPDSDRALEEKADPERSFLDDVLVDSDGGFGYITDSGIFCTPLHGGPLIYDRANDTDRRVPDRHEFTSNEPNHVFDVDGRSVVKADGTQCGADGIALAGDKPFLYRTNFTGNALS